MYWVRPARVLSAAAGMHRFVWNLHYPEPDVLSHDYPISAIYHGTPRYPLGAAVLPGHYLVILSVDGKKYKAAIDLRMDPRVKTSAEDLRRQFELDRKIADALHKDYEAVQQVRSVRAQIKWLQRGKYANSAASSTALDAAAKVATELETKAAALEGEEGGRYLSTPEGRSLVRLNGGFNTLVSGLDTADAAPTTQQSAMFDELNKALAEQLLAWSELKSKDVVELNEELKKAGSPLIDFQKPQKPVPNAADEAQTSSQDRDQNEE
jgi:hypothetical protein